MNWRTIDPAAAQHAAPVDLHSELPRAAPLTRFFDDARRRACPVLLLINDSHRATPTRRVLRAISDAARGVSFRAIVATGTHRFSQAEKAAFEAETLADCGILIDRVVWHDATSAVDDVEIAGVRLNRAVADHSHLLAIGSLEPHYFAGLTGAHKTLTIGVMARADVERNHAGALDPASDVLRLDGNPVHDGIATVVRNLAKSGKNIVAINLIVRGDDVTAVAVGDPLQTLHELHPAAMAAFVATIPAPVDALHLRVPMPLGRSFYQADKALKNNHRAVRDGGGILLEADCPEGVGPDHFMGLLRRAPDYAAALRLVEIEGYRLGDHKAVKLRHLTDPKARGVRVAMVSAGLAAADSEIAGMRRFETVGAAQTWLSESIGVCREGVVIEDAGNATVSAASS